MADHQRDIARIQERIVEADLRMSDQITRIEWMVENGYDASDARTCSGGWRPCTNNGMSGDESSWTPSPAAEGATRTALVWRQGSGLRA